MRSTGPYRTSSFGTVGCAVSRRCGFRARTTRASRRRPSSRRSCSRNEGQKREEMGREAFLDEIWKWKEEHGGIILEAVPAAWARSCDWSRTGFTMDDGPVARRPRERSCDLFDKRELDLPRGSPGQLGLRAEDGGLGRRDRVRREARRKLWLPEAIPVDGQAGANTWSWRRRAPRRCSADTGVCGAPRRRPLQSTWSGRTVDPAASLERQDPDRRGRVGRCRVRLRRGQGHAGPRPRGLRARRAPQPPDHQRSSSPTGSLNDEGGPVRGPLARGSAQAGRRRPRGARAAREDRGHHAQRARSRTARSRPSSRWSASSGS